MRNNYYDYDREDDRRSRRADRDGAWGDSGRYETNRSNRAGNNRYNSYDDSDSRLGWDREENRSTYFGGRDRMDMDRDDYNDRERYSGSDRGWSETGRHFHADDRDWNESFGSLSARNGNRYEHDDDRSRPSSGYYGYPGRERGGWFPGRENRYGNERREREDRDERNYSSRNWNNDSDRNSGRGRGWFGESERQSDASERGWRRR